VDGDLHIGGNDVRVGVLHGAEDAGQLDRPVDENRVLHDNRRVGVQCHQGQQIGLVLVDYQLLRLQVLYLRVQIDLRLKEVRIVGQADALLRLNDRQLLFLRVDGGLE